MAVGALLIWRAATWAPSFSGASFYLPRIYCGSLLFLVASLMGRVSFAYLLLWTAILWPAYLVPPFSFGSTTFWLPSVLACISFESQHLWHAPPPYLVLLQPYNLAILSFAEHLLWVASILARVSFVTRIICFGPRRIWLASLFARLSCCSLLFRSLISYFFQP